MAILENGADPYGERPSGRRSSAASPDGWSCPSRRALLDVGIPQCGQNGPFGHKIASTKAKSGFLVMEVRGGKNGLGHGQKLLMAIILSLAGGVVKCIVAITEPVKSIGRKKMTANENVCPRRTSGRRRRGAILLGRYHVGWLVGAYCAAWCLATDVMEGLSAMFKRALRALAVVLLLVSVAPVVAREPLTLSPRPRPKHRRIAPPTRWFGSTRRAAFTISRGNAGTVGRSTVLMCARRKPTLREIAEHAMGNDPPNASVPVILKGTHQIVGYYSGAIPAHELVLRWLDCRAP